MRNCRDRRGDGAEDQCLVQCAPFSNRVRRAPLSQRDRPAESSRAVPLASFRLFPLKHATPPLHARSQPLRSSYPPPIRQASQPAPPFVLSPFPAHCFSPRAFASFTIGHKGAKGGLGLELAAPANQEVYLMLESRDGTHMARLKPHLIAATSHVPLSSPRSSLTNPSPKPP